MPTMDMTIDFAGGAKVNAHFGGLTIPTDQSPKAGGEGSAPEPYMLFLSSIGTCAGIYVLRFCQSRNIPTDNIRIDQRMHFSDKGALERIDLDIRVPADFPEKYRETLVRVADQCAVKKTILDPPVFSVRAATA